MKNQTDTLQEAILLLEAEHALQLVMLKEQLHTVHDSLKPVNLLKGAFQKVTASPEIKTNLLDNAIGIGAGLLSKKLLVGSTHNPIKKLLGVFIEFAVAKVVAKHTGGIKTAGANLAQRLLK